MARTLLIALAAGALSSILFAPVLADSPIALILSPFSMLPLLMVGLGLGFGPATLAGAGATLFTGLIAGALGAGLFAVAEAIPALALSRQALKKTTAPDGTQRWYPPGRLIAFGTLYACLLFLAALIVFADREGGLRGFILGNLGIEIEGNWAGEIEGPFAPTQEADGQTGAAAAAMLARAIASLLPATLGAWWVFLMIANLALAQGLLTRMGKNLRPGLGLAMLQVPRWVGFALAASVIVALAGSGDAAFIGWTLAIILAVPYFFVGMVVLHLMCRNWAPGWAFLVGFYLLLVFRGWPAFAAAGLGLIEQWVKLRQRMAGPQSGQE